MLRTRESGKHMPSRFLWSWAAVLFAFSTAAYAQTSSSSTPVTKYDGTYALVSLTKLHETYAQLGTNWIRRCPTPKPGSLIIVNGQARYTTSSGKESEGTVGSQGELAMQSSAPSKYAGPSEIATHGRINGDGTVTARRMSNGCSYDLIWQKSK